MNSRNYKDTLEQYVEQKEVSRLSGQPQVRASLPAIHRDAQGTRDVSDKNAADFYGYDAQPAMSVTGGRSRVGASIDANPSVKSQPMVKPPPITRRPAGQKTAVDEQTLFMKQAINNNILLKRDADTFFGENDTENPANFVRNYNEFYRG